MNNFISVNFQTHVSIWFLISMKFCTRMINKKKGYEGAIAPKVVFDIYHKIYVINLSLILQAVWIHFFLKKFPRGNSLKPLSIFEKRSILDVWQGSKYVSGCSYAELYEAILPRYTKLDLAAVQYSCSSFITF